MEQYSVPQFIEVEDKVIGPLTLRQFLYLLSGAGACAMAYLAFDLALFIFSTIFIIGLTAALAFVKINGRPVPDYAASVVHYFTRPKLLLWSKEKEIIKATDTKKRQIKKEEEIGKPKELEKGRLHELSLILDKYGQSIPERSQGSSK